MVLLFAVLGLAQAPSWAILSGLVRHDRARTVSCSFKYISLSSSTAQGLDLSVSSSNGPRHNMFELD
jgi:hypothetical protein